MITDYYFIDIENVGLNGLTGIIFPETNAHIRIFLSEMHHTANVDIEADMIRSKATIDTYFCSTKTKNAMDFEIAATLGAVLQNKDIKRICIISKDMGYRALAEYTKKTRPDVDIYFSDTIMEAFFCIKENFHKSSNKNAEKVDFKHIMNKINERKGKTESAIAELLSSDISNRDKYNGLLHILGREEGIRRYREYKTGVRI